LLPSCEALPSGSDLSSEDLLPRFDLRAQVLRSGGLLRSEALRSGRLRSEVLRSGHLRAQDLLPQALPPSPSLPELRAEDLLPRFDLLRAGGPVLWSGRLPDVPADGPGRYAGPADAQKGLVPDLTGPTPSGHVQLSWTA